MGQGQIVTQTDNSYNPVRALTVTVESGIDKSDAKGHRICKSQNPIITVSSSRARYVPVLDPRRQRRGGEGREEEEGRGPAHERGHEGAGTHVQSRGGVEIKRNARNAEDF